MRIAHRPNRHSIRLHQAALVLAAAVGVASATPTSVNLDDPDSTDLRIQSFDGDCNSAHLGMRAVGLGDINGDGFDDFGLISVASPEADKQVSAKIYLGGIGGELSTLAIGAKDSVSAIGGAGDIDGDGSADFVLSSFPPSPGLGNEEGALRIISGASFGDAEHTVIASIVGENSGEYLGYATSPAGDFDGDGLADLFFGIPGSNPGDLYKAGTAALLYGGDALSPDTRTLQETDRSRFAAWEGAAERDHLGLSISGAGDFNGDGFDDGIAGAWFGDNADGHNIGEVRLLLGGPRADGRTGRIRLRHTNRRHSFRFYGANTDSRLGFSIAGIGDFNGDGFGDIVLGAPHAGDPTLGGDQRIGEAWVIFGGGSMVNSMDSTSVDVIPERRRIRLKGTALGNFAGFSVSSAGDFNCDGFADLIVTEPGFGAETNFGQMKSGAAWLIFGGDAPISFGNDLTLSDLPAERGIKFTCNSGSGMAGYTAVHAGDVDGDGASDVLIAAPFASPGDARFGGRVWLVYGNNPKTAPEKYTIIHKQGRAPMRSAGGFPAQTSGGLGRCRIAFATGAGTGQAGSSATTVVLTAPLTWKLRTNRRDWQSATITLQLTVEEANQVGDSPVVTIGGDRADSIYDKADRTITIEADQLGTFRVLSDSSL